MNLAEAAGGKKKEGSFKKWYKNLKPAHQKIFVTCLAVGAATIVAVAVGVPTGSYYNGKEDGEISAISQAMQNKNAQDSDSKQYKHKNNAAYTYGFDKGYAEAFTAFAVGKGQGASDAAKNMLASNVNGRQSKTSASSYALDTKTIEDKSKIYQNGYSKGYYFGYENYQAGYNAGYNSKDNIENVEEESTKVNAVTVNNEEIGIFEDSTEYQAGYSAGQAARNGEVKIPTVAEVAEEFAVVKNAFEGNSGLKATEIKIVNYVPNEVSEGDSKGTLFVYAKGTDFNGEECLIELAVEINDEANMFDEFKKEAAENIPTAYYKMNESSVYSFTDNYINVNGEKESKENVSGKNLWVAAIKTGLDKDKWSYQLQGTIINDDYTVQGYVDFGEKISNQAELDVIYSVLNGFLVLNDENEM